MRNDVMSSRRSLLSRLLERNPAAKSKHYKKIRFTCRAAIRILEPSIDMDNLNYQPKPLDTSQFQLTGDILKISEFLAENTHEIWARERMEQGWKFGPQRDDAKKEHPFLIPYEQLPESEKTLIRNTALETMKTVLSLGYTRQSSQSDTVILNAGSMQQRAKQIIGQFKKTKLSLAELRRLWAERVPILWLSNVEIYRRAVDACLRLGEAFLAFDIAAEGLRTFKNDLRLTQLQALALARTGATRRANQMLEQLRSSGHHDEETLGLLARTYKDFWLIETDAKEKAAHLKMSFELYTEAYRHNRGYYSGINAASMGLLSGEKETAQRLAREVTTMCKSALEKLPADSEERDWLLLTLAEASLILGNFSLAEAQYSEASQSTRQGWAVLNRSRAQARLLLENCAHDPAIFDHCFGLPRIVVFSGHMFDKPERREPRFPQALEQRIRSEIENKLSSLGAQVGFSSLACGSDLIFAEALMARGGEVNLILPFEKDDFKKSSVDILPGLNLSERFENVLENAANVTTLNELGTPESGAAYEYCNQVLIGLALLKSQFLGIDVIPMVVWDGRMGDGRGGTQNFVGYWQKRGTKAEVIRVDKILAEQIQVTARPALVDRTGSWKSLLPVTESVSAQEIKAMLFADIVGYTKLSEAQIPLFVTHFLGKVAALMNSLQNQPIVKNTWGDAMHCVFDDVRDAAIFALELRELVRETDWIKWGLPGDLTIRIALHAGPAFPCFDPILQRLTFLGSHVNRTARIEPIAEEGQIYASQAFAALAAASGVKELVCDYVGRKQLAKMFGAFPVFLVRRATGSERTFFSRRF